MKNFFRRTHTILVATVATMLLTFVASGGNPVFHGGVRIDPPTLIVDRDASGFVQSMIKLYSDHGDSIRVTGVSGSCGCASASVQRPLMHDTTPAKIYVQINAKHFTDSLNTVLYTVNHTGSSKPAVLSVIVRCK
ncbi:MAG: hypothetical protein FGM32_00305 [Candidatus Kapabacteria bacterium]|nr:hypothetical protein [Candidatus Kapabacteria bacterium]